MFDNLGIRMKKNYEKRYNLKLPRRTYTIIRIDGKAFHTYTHGLKRPFDYEFMNDLDTTAKFLCEEIQGAVLAFVQSDEISILLTDFNTIRSEAWFDGGVQKIVSVSASLATAKFNQLRFIRNLVHPAVPLMLDEEKIKTLSAVNFFNTMKLSMFDSRVFIIPDRTEVINYLIWRQNDATRNSIQSVGYSYFSHKELLNLNTNAIQNKLLTEKDINWNDYPIDAKRGRLLYRKKYVTESAIRHEWATYSDLEIFSKDLSFINDLIPEFNGG